MNEISKGRKIITYQQVSSNKKKNIPFISTSKSNYKFCKKKNAKEKEEDEIKNEPNKFHFILF